MAAEPVITFGGLKHHFVHELLFVQTKGPEF